VGAGVAVKDGITIGDGAIIGAGAVVTAVVPADAIYGGVPVRLIRYRFDVETIRLLLESRWWDRDADSLREHADDFTDVNRFKQLVAVELVRG
jgi:virginiamycin A acetyltransferase